MILNIQDAIDSLNYSQYVYNREQCPWVPAHMWGKIFDNAKEYEVLYQMEQKLKEGRDE